MNDTMHRSPPQAVARARVTLSNASANLHNIEKCLRGYKANAKHLERIGATTEPAYTETLARIADAEPKLEEARVAYNNADRTLSRLTFEAKHA